MLLVYMNAYVSMFRVFQTTSIVMAGDSSVRKKKVSKKNKKAWRKFIDTKDVDDFLDEKRLEERLGVPYAERADEDIFVVDSNEQEKKLKDKIIARKREKFQRPYRCLQVLQPSTAVPDPISKRNIGKSSDERRSAFVKEMEIKKRLSGHGMKKRLTVKEYRSAADEKRKERLKRNDFCKDLWAESKECAPVEDNTEWLRKGTHVHILASTGSRLKLRPKTMELKTSVLTPIGAPHPGSSYNPSYQEHRELLSVIAQDELKVIKEEEHLDRVVTKMIPKVTREEVEENWMKEMSQGLPQFEEKKGEDQNSGVEESEDKGVLGNPIVTRDKKKTLQKRRKLREAKAEVIRRREAKLDKKKLSDIERVSLVSKEIAKRDEKLAKLREKRERVKKAKITQPKTLSRFKFEPLDLEFNMRDEIPGNLRNVKPEGSLLKDRFNRMQERNMLETRVRQKKKLKYKRKVYEKPSHKMGWEPKGYD